MNGLIQERRQKQFELTLEMTKLNKAKQEFAGIKRGYIKEYREGAIQQMDEISQYS